MKILSFSLFCFIVFGGLCEDDESDCTKLQREIDLKIAASCIAGSQSTCYNTYSVEFYKDHCGGDPGGTMSYSYNDCYEPEAEIKIMQRQGISFWTVTFRYEEDMLDVTVINPDSKRWLASVSGKQIYDITNGGSTSLVISADIDEAVINISFINPDQLSKKLLGSSVLG